MIQKATNDKWIKPLALYHLLKFSFGNSVLFNYRNRMDELSQRFGLSTKTLYKYLRVLSDKGLIVEKGNQRNLHLISITQFKRDLGDKRKCRIDIAVSDDLSTISAKLYAKLIEHHLRKIAFMKAIKEWRRRDLNKMIAGESAAPLFSLSIRNIAKLLNISTNTVPKLLKSLEYLKILKVHPQKAEQISSDKLDITVVDDLPGHKFVTEKGTFVQFGSKIELIQYPVKIPKISMKKYVKYYKSIKCKKGDNY